jgi:hypothetical protein
MALSSASPTPGQEKSFSVRIGEDGALAEPFGVGCAQVVLANHFQHRERMVRTIMAAEAVPRVTAGRKRSFKRTVNLWSSTTASRRLATSCGPAVKT